MNAICATVFIRLYLLLAWNYWFLLNRKIEWDTRITENLLMIGNGHFGEEGKRSDEEES